MWLVRVDVPFACFGFEVAGGHVVRAAPVAGWMVGKRGAEMVTYWRSRGATVTWEWV